MEEKKFDLNSLIGFVLLGAIMIYYFYANQPTPEQIEQRRAEQVQDSINQLSNEAQSGKTVEPSEFTQEPVSPSDTLAFEQAKNRLGIFAYSAGLPSATDSETVLENELVQIKVANKGGQITEVLLKKYKTFNKLPLYMIKDQNASFNMSFATQDNRNLQTRDLYFEPTLTTNGDRQG